MTIKVTHACLWMVGGSQSTRRPEKHRKNMQTFLLLGNIAIQWTTVPSILPIHIIIKQKIFLSLKKI